MTKRQSILSNVVAVFSGEGSVQMHGTMLKNIARQLTYAGVQVDDQDLRTALDAVSVTCPSVFAEDRPTVSTHYGMCGMEYRFRASDETRVAVRACIDAVYAVTDTLDRTPTTIEIDGQSMLIETIRPHAFAVSMGHLRVRWAKGDFSVPKAATIHRWIA